MKILKRTEEEYRFVFVSGALRWMRKHRWTIIVLSLSFTVSLLIVLFTIQLGSFFFQTKADEFFVGTVAKKDFIVERDFDFVDEQATALREEAVAGLVPPVFQVNEEITRKTLERFDLFRETYLENTGKDVSEEQMYLKLQLAAPGAITREELRPLLPHANPDSIFATARLLLEEVMTEGIVDLPEETAALLGAESVEVRVWKNGRLEPTEVPKESVVTSRSLVAWIEGRINLLLLDSVSGQFVSVLVRVMAEENAFVDREQSDRKREKAQEGVEPVLKRLHEGQIVVRKGDIVTDDAAAAIRAIGEYSITVNLNSIAASSLILIIIFATSVYLVRAEGVGVGLRRKPILFLLGSGVFYLLLSGVLLKAVHLPDWLPFSVVLPTATFSIIVALLISTEGGILYSVIVALLLLPMTKMDAFAFSFALFSGIAGTAVVRKAQKRIDLVRAGLYLSLLNAAVVTAIGFFLNYDPRDFLVALGWGVGNGFFCGILSLGFLPILEHALNSPTRFVLMELSDLNTSVMKRMLSFAPGTYNHSIVVANLAESACTEIGANALLARVGGYYHDIGKIDQAAYFVENQRSGNKHDELKPSLSAAVIKSHVKIGIEKGKELRLPQEVIDIISQHHGKALIKYFYQRAVDGEANGKVSRDDYSYPGLRPRSKEAAVVMLADSAEAASRALRRPSIAKLEKLTWSLITEKLNSGELSQSNLTLKDLEVIQNSFIQILAGHFHSRIEYPKIKEAVR